MCRNFILLNLTIRTYCLLMRIVAMMIQSFLKMKKSCVKVVFILFLPMVSTASIGKVNSDFNQLYSSVLNDFNKPAADNVLAWKKMLSSLTTLSDLQKLNYINQYFAETLHYEIDQTVYGQNDYWASLGETLGVASGDCEDYAIAKYVSLRLAGIPDSKLRLIYVKAQIGGLHSSLFQAHMVLGYYADEEGEAYILDSLTSDIQKASMRPDLKTIYSFNAKGLWLGEKLKFSSNSTKRLSRWQQVLVKTQQQGILL